MTEDNKSGQLEGAGESPGGSEPTMGSSAPGSAEKDRSVPPTSADNGTAKTESDDNSGVGAAILIGLVVAFLVCSWIGWASIIRVVLFCCAGIGGIVAIVCGIVFWTTSDKERQGNAGVLGFVCSLAAIFAWTLLPSSPPAPTSPTPTAPAPTRMPTVEEVLLIQLQQVLSDRKQEIFMQLHPVGTAKSVSVHDVAITWKRGQRTNRIQDILSLTTRFTLYWQGPMTSDGYTKVNAVLDLESMRWGAPQILATNGMTRQQSNQILLDIGEAILSDWIQQQRSQ